MRRLILQNQFDIVQLPRLGEGEGGGTAGAGASGGTGDTGTGTGGTPPAAAPPAGSNEGGTTRTEPPTWEYVEKIRREAAENRTAKKALEDEIKRRDEEKLSETEKAKKEAADNKAEADRERQARIILERQVAVTKAGCQAKYADFIVGKIAIDCADLVPELERLKKEYPEFFRAPQAPPARTTSGQAAGAQDAGIGQDINAAIRQAARR